MEVLKFCFVKRALRTPTSRLYAPGQHGVQMQNEQEQQSFCLFFVKEEILTIRDLRHIIYLSFSAIFQAEKQMNITKKRPHNGLRKGERHGEREETC